MSAGDEIEAEVTPTSTGTGTMAVTNVTSGQRTTASEPAAYAGSSAEWVVEQSGVAGSLALKPLADFGVVTFTDVSSIPSGDLSYADAIEMLRANGSATAIPSQIQGDTSFRITYEPRG